MTRKTKNTLTSTALLALILACAFCLPMGCGTLGGPDLEGKLIAAATKCITDASTILAAQREADVTEHAAVQLIALQREANEKKCDGAPAAAATPLQSRKP
jgi:hypothetical protein